MASRVYILCLLLVFSIIAPDMVTTSAVAWGYAKDSAHGPSQWKEDFPDCDGVMQSPIDIDTKHVLYDADLEYFDVGDYSKTDGVELSLHNVGGHTAEVMYTGTPVYLRGGSLPDTYQVDQFHFHWGSKDTRGSEHSVNGFHSPMEMHIVHHQTHLGNISEAMPHPHGLAVLGFFFKVGKHNPNYDLLLNHFDKIAMPGNHSQIPTIKLSDLINVKQLDFYRYMGSLTTPPCYETVIWSLAEETIEVSEAQINKFRNLFHNESERLADDFRPIQERHSRTVTTTSKYVKETGNGVDGLHMSLVTLVLCCILSVFSKKYSDHA